MHVREAEARRLQEERQQIHKQEFSYRWSQNLNKEPIKLPQFNLINPDDNNEEEKKYQEFKSHQNRSGEEEW